MKHLRCCLIILALIPQLTLAQSRSFELQVGYVTPFLLHQGASLGLAMAWPGAQAPQAGMQPTHALYWLPQVSYFRQRQVSQQILLDPGLQYRWHPKAGPFYLSASLGAGYLLSWQKQSGRLNLATGQLDHQTETQSFFVPTLGLGLGLAARKRLGFYLQAAIGQQLGANPAAFANLAVGLSFHLNHSHP
jgi:hypothetical protein